MYKSIFLFFFFYICLVLLVILLSVVSYSPFKLSYSTPLIILTMRFFHLLSSLTSWNDSPALIINGHHSPPSSPLLFSLLQLYVAPCFVFFVLNFLIYAVQSLSLSMISAWVAPFIESIYKRIISSTMKSRRAMQRRRARVNHWRNTSLDCLLLFTFLFATICAATRTSNHQSPARRIRIFEYLYMYI